MMIDCEQIVLLSTAENILRYLLTLIFNLLKYRKVCPGCVFLYKAARHRDARLDANKLRLLTLASTVLTSWECGCLELMISRCMSASEICLQSPKDCMN